MTETTTYDEQPDRADRVVRPFLYIFGATGLFLLIFVLPGAQGGDELGSEWRWVLALVVFLLGVALFGWLAQLGKPGRLELDEEGLGYRARFQKAPRRWPWRELSAFTLQRRKSGDFIVFSVPADGRVKEPERSDRVRPDGRIELRIRGDFGEPLERLAARLNRMRAAAPGVFEEAPAGESTEYRADAERDLRVEWWFAAAMISIVLMAFFDSVAVQLCLLGLGLAFFALQFVTRGIFPTRPPKDNFLRLDVQGLTYVRDGASRTWSWRDLDQIALHDGRPIWLRPFGRFITVAIPDDDGEPRVLRRLCRLWRRRPTLMIADIYLAPLEEVAAKMRAYRERALSNEGTGPPRTD